MRFLAILMVTQFCFITKFAPVIQLCKHQLIYTKQDPTESLLKNTYLNIPLPFKTMKYITKVS